MWPNWQFIGRLRSYFLKNTSLRVRKMVQSRPNSQNFAFSKNSLVDRSKNKLLSKFKTPMVDRPKQWILKPKYIWLLIIQKRVFHNISEINIKTPSKQYRWYHLNSPPPFLADFGDRSKTGFKGNYQISRYHTNSPPPFFTEKKCSRGGGIKVISSVFKLMAVTTILGKIHSEYTRMHD